MSIDQSEQLRLDTLHRTRNPHLTLVAFIRRWASVQALRIQIRKERRELARLPDNLLKDMGIDRAEALQESSKPLRDIPPQRLHHQLGKYWLMRI